MKKNNQKRGFTVVELVIVIAVIAILAAVLIPTYANLVKKAKTSNDEALVNNLNKILAVEAITDRDTLTYAKACEYAEKNGISPDKITPAIMWDNTNKKFALAKDGQTDGMSQIYNSSNKFTAENGVLDLTGKGGVILGSDAVSGEATKVIIDGNFDAGNYTFAEVEFATNDSKTVDISTNGGKLTVNAPNATVNHRGSADGVVITAVASASYHEYGNVNGTVEITKGHIVIEKSATTGTITVSDAAVANEVKITNNANSKLVVIDAENKISADSKIGDSVKLKDKDAVAIIGDKSYKTLKEALAAAKDGDTVKMVADYVMTADNTSDTVEDRLIINKKITFDFGNYRIIGFTEMDRYNNNFVALIVDADTTFIAGENGGIFADLVSDGGPYAVNIRKGATLTVKSGTYFGSGTSIQVQKGHLEILGGKFMAHPYSNPVYGYYFMINAIDAAYKDGTATIAIKGGSFYKFDPADSKSENPRGEFVADGYLTNCENEWYTVVPQR